MAYSIRKYQLKDGVRFEVRYRKPDGASTSKRGFKRKMDADTWAAANITTAQALGGFIDPQAGNATVGELWEPWIAKKRISTKPTYVATLEASWRTHVKHAWESRPVAGIKRGEVQKWVGALSKKRSASVVIRCVNILSGILADAVKDSRIPTNPAEGVELPRKQRRKHVYLAGSELFALADNCGWRRLIVLTLGLCGMRWGELVALRVEDVDLQRNRIHIHRSISRVGTDLVESDTKTHESRMVMFPAILREELRTQCEGRCPTDFLFTMPGRPTDKPMSDGGRPTSEGGWFFVALRRTGIERGHMTIHDLRHTAASLMIQSGANVKTVQRQLGHKSATMTLDTYADLFDDDLDSLSQSMDDLLFSQNVGKMWANNGGEKEISLELQR
ncbi:integrase [Bifidobacterium sp. DSM 109963]|uniref:Integrase n=2 Tax=Bifidobacterium panos TaxID=2675321 RepID=A0ABX1T1G2_9BIFI|nr:integrase [Bifidobacterium sp. DSM 109963]